MIALEVRHNFDSAALYTFFPRSLSSQERLTNLRIVLRKKLYVNFTKLNAVGFGMRRQLKSLLFLPVALVLLPIGWICYFVGERPIRRVKEPVALVR